MRLTRYTDYCLRVLMYVGLKGEELSTIQEVAERYGISRNHLMKVVHQLNKLGYVETVRGKGGGFRLRQAPEDVNLGVLVRSTEEDLMLVECFQAGNDCRIDASCRLKGILGEALAAFLGVLDNYTLQDLLSPRAELARILLFVPPGAKTLPPA
ncbi:RrF2 family transcriptional regulator [Alkalilimnicola sp. S0819]|uniref:RrF2 family transcriptional regulator n=1 Tax=Alkalilimnicola sp. S0819 TaxID=2613922 RepID=UPI0012615555|nr:Rrf2 family transcriptional regulator [Alkalilimnicola sp. S0819]KAB7622577.1 Rrf2 family transcriptional regulator [Alkalilimnicola sp. S0819]MPQ17465.1 Rrf2 family transcriptional regulator [Alkalilimnicola sp. S0819]